MNLRLKTLPCIGCSLRREDSTCRRWDMLLLGDMDVGNEAAAAFAAAAAAV